MTVSIIGCGQTAEHWNEVPCDLSIGVNDAFKFGHKFNLLCLFNHKAKFTQARQQTILNTRPVKLYTHCLSWIEHFPDHVKVKVRSWDGHLYDDITRLMHADTGPFIGMSLAYCLGASKIILWGVEFKTHGIYNESNPETKIELRKYQQLVTALSKVGIQTYLGKEGSLLEEFVPVWKSQQ